MRDHGYAACESALVVIPILQEISTKPPFYWLILKQSQNFRKWF